MLSCGFLQPRLLNFLPDVTTPVTSPHHHSYICRFSVQLHAAALSCASAGSSMQFLQCNSTPLPMPTHQPPARCSQTFSSTLHNHTHAASTRSPHSSNQHTSAWYQHTPDPLIQPYNLTTSVVSVSLYRSQTLQPHEAPNCLHTSSTLPSMPKYFSSMQPTTSACIPAHLNSQCSPVRCFPCSCWVASNTVSKQQHLSPPLYKITLFPHSSLPLFSKNLVFLLPFLNISVPWLCLPYCHIPHLYVPNFSVSSTYISVSHSFGHS